jgi:hypothetical protein
MEVLPAGTFELKRKTLYFSDKSKQLKDMKIASGTLKATRTTGSQKKGQTSTVTDLQLTWVKALGGWVGDGKVSFYKDYNGNPKNEYYRIHKW